MQQLRYQIKNLAPIILSARSGDTNMVGTLQYIPGTSVLGMIAARFLNQKNITSEAASSSNEFHHFFLAGDICFGNAFAVFKDEKGKEYVHFPTPHSIQKEKRGEQIYDLLLMNEEPEEQTKAIRCFCHLDDENIAFTEVETGLNFHHARDRETGISKDAIIFNYESIAEGQTFQGVIKGSAEALQNLAAVCGSTWTGYIGRSKNAQYGKISFEFIDKNPQPVSDKVTSDTEISLTLLSDTILYNENGFSTTDPCVLEKYLGVKISKFFIRQEDAETFVSVWRMKKPSETCFQAGSCFLLEVSDEADLTRLAELQKTGVGERTHEGFGQCILGWQTEDELTETILKKPEIQKPTAQMPQTAKNILKTLIQNAVRKQVALDAMSDMGQFKKKLPSPSLIGRLNAMSAQLDREKFVESLGKLRRSAADKLKDCRNNEKNLMDFLTDKTVSAKEMFQKSKFPNVLELCGEIGYK